MTPTEIIIFATEIIGTVAFSISGALIAIASSLDLFGVVFVGGITAVGGGIIRDLMLHQGIPNIFNNQHVLILSFATSLLVFLLVRLFTRKFLVLQEKIDHINNIFDAMGLAAFSITGIEVACNSGHESEAFFAISMGVITGVGGGVLRDVLVNRKPYILEKHIYALVSFAACTLYYYFRNHTSFMALSVIVVIVLTVATRLLAAKFHWKLPKIHLD